MVGVRSQERVRRKERGERKEEKKKKRRKSGETHAPTVKIFVRHNP
jgi:hypothetical protein